MSALPVPEEGKELLPCPFCGGEAMMESQCVEMDMDEEKSVYNYSAICRCCAASGPWKKNEAGAVRLWNERQPTALDWRGKE